MARETTGGGIVGWFCTYTPEEIIYAAGFVSYRLLPHHNDCNSSVEDALPASVCPYPRKILNNIRSGIYHNLEGVVVANSCNSMMHLYNVLKEENGLFVYLLDIPRQQDERATAYFARELELLANYLGRRGRPVNSDNLTGSLSIYRQRNKLLDRAVKHSVSDNFNHTFPEGLFGLSLEAATTDPEKMNNRLAALLEKINPVEKTERNNSIALMLAGGLPPQGLIKMLTDLPELNLYPENCAGLRYLQKPQAAFDHDQDPAQTNNLYLSIARAYLEKPPCPRVFNRQAREEYYRSLLDSLKVQGVIYHDLMFCDLCHYDYLMLQTLLTEKEIPHLKIKTKLGVMNYWPF